jgi:hypothetical protein
MSAIAATRRAIASGHRATFQIPRAVLPPSAEAMAPAEAHRRRRAWPSRRRDREHERLRVLVERVAVLLDAAQAVEGALIWPISVVPVMSAPIVPTAIAIHCPSEPARCAWSTAVVRTRPAGPGTIVWRTSTIVRLKPPLPTALAIPTAAMTAWTKTSVNRKAIDRAWLKPSE